MSLVLIKGRAGFVSRMAEIVDREQRTIALARKVALEADQRVGEMLTMRPYALSWVGDILRRPADSPMRGVMIAVLNSPNTLINDYFMWRPR